MAFNKTTHHSGPVDSLNGFSVNGTTVINSSGVLITAPAAASGEIDAFQAGKSGTVGSVTIYPATSAKGSLKLSCTAQTGNTQVNLVAAAMGQATVVTIPDPGATTTNVLLDTGTNASGTFTTATATTLNFATGGSLVADKGTGTEASNAVTISKMAGVITTSSLNTAGGSTYVITVTNTKCATTSVVSVQWMGGGNSTANFSMKAVPGSGSFVITIYNNTAATALNGTIIIGFNIC